VTRLERARGSLHRGRVRTGPQTGVADPSGPGRLGSLEVTGQATAESEAAVMALGEALNLSGGGVCIALRRVP
jgi:hypothetical protein